MMLDASHGVISRPGGLEPEALLLCLCCRQQFDQSHHDAVQEICARNAIRWDRVCEAASAHGVAPLVGANLAHANSRNAIVPRDTLIRFKLATAMNRGRKELVGSAVAELLAYCNERAVPVMLLKGLALEHSIYQAPWYTVSSDVDMALGVEQEALAREDRDGLVRLTEELEGRTECGWECDWFAHHDITMGVILPVSFRQIWDDSISIRYRDRAAFVMCPEDMLIAACISCHRRRYLRLKLLCDVAETLRRNPRIDWDRVLSKSRQYQCSSIVYAAIVAANSVLGLESPIEFLPGPDVGRVRAQIIALLFGRADRHLRGWTTGRLVGIPEWALLKTYATLPLGHVHRRLRLFLNDRFRRRLNSPRRARRIRPERQF
jgi:hypothetical protein